MNRERVVFFLDFANINRAAKDGLYRLDYAHLLEYMAEGRFLVEAHAYVPIDPRNEHHLDGLIERLWQCGYVVRQKVGSIAGSTYKCDFDVEITIDVLHTAYQVRPDIIVLGTGDGDFAPLVQEVRRLGIRLEVASFEASASRDLRLKSSGFISLDAYCEEVAAGRTLDSDTPEPSPIETDIGGADPHPDVETPANLSLSEVELPEDNEAGSLPHADNY